MWGSRKALHHEGSAIYSMADRSHVHCGSVGGEIRWEKGFLCSWDFLFLKKIWEPIENSQTFPVSFTMGSVERNRKGMAWLPFPVSSNRKRRRERGFLFVAAVLIL